MKSNCTGDLLIHAHLSGYKSSGRYQFMEIIITTIVIIIIIQFAGGQKCHMHVLNSFFYVIIKLGSPKKIK